MCLNRVAKWAIGLLVLVGFCCVGLFAFRRHNLANSGEPVRIGCELPGTQILYHYAKEVAFPDVVNRSLLLRTNGDTAPLMRFSQLQGRVHITSEQQALDYVRFRNSLYTFYYWADNGGYEVLTEQMAESLPAYGLNRYYHRYPGGEGDAGVLSALAYKQGRFTPATVKKRNNGFEVTRWLFVPNQVEKVQEFVSAEGVCRRVILEQRPPPKLPHTYWRVPTFA